MKDDPLPRSPVSEHLPPVPPPIGQRRSNAGPRGAHADLLQRVHEIFGPLPVIDATEPLTLHPLPIDAEGAEPRDPGNCLLAHCAARELGARTVAFFRGTTYLDRIGPDGERRIERYMNSAAARRLVVAFDSGTQPITADTTLTLLPPYKQFTIADKRERSRKFDQTPAGRARTELSHARTAVRNANANAERIQKRLANLRAADNGSAQARRQIERWEKSRTRAAERLVEVAERLKCAERAVAEAKKLQGVTTRPRRHLDLTTRSGAEGRYVFGSAADGSNQ